MKVSKEQRFAFWVGSWAGVLQAFIGILVASNHGSWAAFFASLAAYLAVWKMYVWAVGKKEEKSNERSSK